jgi:hypothetical protein
MSEKGKKETMICIKDPWVSCQLPGTREAANPSRGLDKGQVPNLHQRERQGTDRQMIGCRQTDNLHGGTPGQRITGTTPGSE